MYLWHLIIYHAMVYITLFPTLHRCWTSKQNTHNGQKQVSLTQFEIPMKMAFHTSDNSYQDHSKDQLHVHDSSQFYSTADSWRKVLWMSFLLEFITPELWLASFTNNNKGFRTAQLDRAAICRFILQGVQVGFFTLAKIANGYWSWCQKSCPSNG